MKSPFRQYLEALRQFPATILQHPDGFIRRPGRDFTRRRSLYLERMMWFSTSLYKTSLAVNMDQLFAALPEAEFSVTKSALVQARQKLLPRFYNTLLQYSANCYYLFYKTKRWKGHRLWAADGSGFRVPDDPALGEEFGWHENQHTSVPSARMVVWFDLLNQIVTQLKFHPRAVSEFIVGLSGVATIPKDTLVIYDRGYASHILPFLHQHYGSNCIIRVPLDRSNSIKAFIDSGMRQKIITEPLQIRAINAAKLLGIPLEDNPTITYRLIRVELQTGEVEVLCIF